MFNAVCSEETRWRHNMKNDFINIWHVMLPLFILLVKYFIFDFYFSLDILDLCTLIKWINKGRQYAPNTIKVHTTCYALDCILHPIKAMANRSCIYRAYSCAKHCFCVINCIILEWSLKWDIWMNKPCWRTAVHRFGWVSLHVIVSWWVSCIVFFG